MHIEEEIEIDSPISEQQKRTANVLKFLKLLRIMRESRSGEKEKRELYIHIEILKKKTDR